ncbi:MAG: hypothetical protein ACRDHN_05975, partial [Thermomicrobiales bacterium]
MTTKNALDHLRLGLPYYRFKIRALKYSMQHDLLLALEAQGNDVCYAAPRFHKPDELNDAFSNAKVVERSAFVLPSSIGTLPDQEEHTISFSQVGFAAKFRSEPRDIVLSAPDLFFGTVLRARRRKTVAPAAGSFRELGNQLIEIYASRVPQIDADRARRLRADAAVLEPIGYAHFIALALFDSELLV